MTGQRCLTLTAWLSMLAGSSDHSMRRQPPTEPSEASVMRQAVLGLALMAAAASAAAKEPWRPGDPVMYRVACHTHAGALKLHETRGQERVEGCYQMRRPWPAELVERHEAIRHGKVRGHIWRVRDLPPPHEEAWILLQDKDMGLSA